MWFFKKNKKKKSIWKQKDNTFVSKAPLHDQKKNELKIH